MLGTIVNTVCIVVGSVAGSLLKSRIEERYQNALYNAMGLVTLALGANMCVSNLGKSSYPVLFIVSIALGSLIGMKLDIAGRIERAAERRGATRLVHGLTTACLLYCIGTLSIVGPVLSAVKGDNTFLFTNATLDLVTSAIFGATYGIGMVWGALVLFCWQGSIYAVAWFLNSGSAIPEPMICEVSIVGGLLLLSSGLAILGIKDCKTINMLPALIFPVLYLLLFG